MCANHDDDINLIRIINTPRRGIGRTTIEQLNAIASSRHCSLWDAIESVIRYCNGYVKTGDDELDAEAESEADDNATMRTSAAQAGGSGATSVTDDDTDWFGSESSALKEGSPESAAFRLGAKTIADLQSFHDLIVNCNTSDAVHAD